MEAAAAAKYGELDDQEELELLPRGAADMMMWLPEFLPPWGVWCSLSEVHAAALEAMPEELRPGSCAVTLEALTAAVDMGAADTEMVVGVQRWRSTPHMERALFENILTTYTYLHGQVTPADKRLLRDLWPDLSDVEVIRQIAAVLQDSYAFPIPLESFKGLAEYVSVNGWPEEFTWKRSTVWRLAREAAEREGAPLSDVASLRG